MHVSWPLFFETAIEGKRPHPASPRQEERNKGQAAIGQGAKQEQQAAGSRPAEDGGVVIGWGLQACAASLGPS